MSNKGPEAYGELTLRDVILAIQSYLNYFISKWYWFLIVCCLMTVYLAYEAKQKPVVYSAPLTFTLEGGVGGQLIGGSILGQLGLGGNSEGGVSLKLLDLSRTRKVVTPVLFDSVQINGIDDYLANHLIRAYDLQEGWKDSESLKGFTFTAIPGDNDKIGNRVLKILHRMVTNVESEDVLFRMLVNEQTGVFTMDARTVSDDLSLALVERMFSSLESFHITASSRQKIETLSILSQRADSVKTLLQTAEAQYAREQDRSSRITLRQNTLREQRLSRDILILSTMYAEVLKNKETASFLLSSEKPSFIVIDRPLIPLQTIRASMLQAGIYGVVGGGFLVAFVLFFVNLVKTTMREEEVLTNG